MRYGNKNIFVLLLHTKNKQKKSIFINKMKIDFLYSNDNLLRAVTKRNSLIEGGGHFFELM